MRDENRERIERWLHAGAAESPGPEVEAAWTGLFAALPEVAPSSELADRVMRRVARVRRASRDLAPRWRFALAAGLLLFGASALSLPALLLEAPIPVGAVIAAITNGVTAGAAWVAQGISFWRLLASIAETTSLVVATREAATFLAGFALVSAAALRLLYDLTLYDRRSTGAVPR